MLFLLTVFIIFVWLRYHHHGKLSLAVLESWILFAFVSYGLTELAGIGNSITYPTWLIGWSSLTVGLAFVVVFRLIATKQAGNRIVEFGQKISIVRQNIEVFLIVLLFLATLFMSGLRFPPNTYDSMTYHLARVEHWIANKNTDYYPTHITRQLYMQPLAEIIILQFRILHGTEQTNFLPQWLALIACLAAGWYLTNEISGKRAALLSLLLIITAPMAILQANSTQNDLVAASMLMAASVYTYLCIQKPTLKRYLWLGLIVGLGLLTKGTLYLLLFPIPFLIIGSQLKAFRLKKLSIHELLKQGFFAGIACCLAIVINLPQYWRNVQMMSAPIGATPDELPYLIKPQPNFAIANFVKNSSMQLQSKLALGNSAIAQTVTYFVEKTLKIESINHPAICYNLDADGVFGYKLNSQFNNEEVAGNPLHTILFLLSIGWFLRQKKRPSWLLFLIPSVGFMIAFTAIKWQPWITRLQLPSLLVAMPLTALFLASIKSFKQGIVMGVLLLVGLIILFTNTNKDLTKNFQNSDDVGSSKLNQVIDVIIATNAVKPQDAIGVLAGHGNFWEYPLLYRLHTEAYPNPKVEHVMVNNVSKKLAETHDLPTMIVCFDCNSDQVLQLSQSHQIVVNYSPEVSLWTTKNMAVDHPLLLH